MVRSQVSAAVMADEQAVLAAVVSERLVWLAQMVRAEARSRVAEVWAAQAVSAIGDSHASHAWVALDEVYGRRSWPPDHLHASDRVRRMANEVAGRTLRSAARQIGLLEAVLPAILPQAVFISLDPKSRTPLPWPADTAGTERRDTIRAIRHFEQESGALPESAYQVISCPSFDDETFLCPLEAADDQQVRLNGLELSLLLPVCELPGQGDWSWHKLTLKLPDFAQKRYAAGALCRPSLRLTPDKAYLLVPLDLPVPELIESDWWFATDWGRRRLSTGTIVKPDPRDPGGRAITTGRPYFFNARQIQGKWDRQRRQAEILEVKIAQIGKLLASRTDRALAKRRDKLTTEKGHLERRASRSRRQVAYAGARWEVEIALTEQAGGLALEDLASLQSTDRGRIQNGKTNAQPRGLVQDKTSDLARLSGLRVAKVNPRGTSAFCSRCGRPSVFWHAPDRQSGDPNWLVCLCGRSADRDQAAAEAIGALALDAPKTSPRGRRHNPTPGPATRRKVRVQRDKHRVAQEISYPYHPHMFDANADNNPPQPQRRTAQHSKTTHTPLRSGVYRQTTPRRVSRGSAVVARQAERSSLTNRDSPERLRAKPPRSLDGLSAGFWHAVKFSRPRALAAIT
jgi:hypothetical protein